MFAPAHLPLRVLSYQLIRTSFKYYSKVFPTGGGAKTLYIARYYRNSLPSPSSTDISIAERQFRFGMVVGFTIVGFEGKGVGGAKVLTIIKISLNHLDVFGNTVSTTLNYPTYEHCHYDC